MTKNSSEIYNEVYVAGYNQAKVDYKLMTRDAADKINIKVNSEET